MHTYIPTLSRRDGKSTAFQWIINVHILQQASGTMNPARPINGNQFHRQTQRHPSSWCSLVTPHQVSHPVNPWKCRGYRSLLRFEAVQGLFYHSILGQSEVHSLSVTAFRLLIDWCFLCVQEEDSDGRHPNDATHDGDTLWFSRDGRWTMMPSGAVGQFLYSLRNERRTNGIHYIVEMHKQHWRIRIIRRRCWSWRGRQLRRNDIQCPSVPLSDCRSLQGLLLLQQ